MSDIQCRDRRRTMMWRDAKRRPVTDAVNPQLTEGDWEPGAVQRWVVPVEPDYEAAAKALWEDETPVLGLPQPWDDQVPDLQAEYIEAARRTVDAAYGIGGNDD